MLYRMFPKPADDALTDLHWRIRRFCREYPLSIELSDLIVQWTREAYATGVVTNIAVTPEPITVRCDRSECVCINRCQFCGVAADICDCDYDD